MALAALGRVRSADTKKLLAHATRSLRSGHACNFFVLLPRLGKKSVVFIFVFSSRRTRPHLLGRSSAPAFYAGQSGSASCCAYNLPSQPGRGFRPARLRPRPPRCSGIALNRREGSQQRPQLPPADQTHGCGRRCFFCPAAVFFTSTF